jgi:hypothetical protein
MENQLKLQDFEKGFENGISQVPKNEYQEYLAETVNLDFLSENLRSVKDKINSKKIQIENLKEQYISSLSEEEGLMVEFGEQEFQKNRIDTNIEKLEARIEEARLEKKTDTSPYPFLAGLIYLLAGITFIVGDLIISHEIVAYALNIKNNFHAWAFAFGLASVSILLKPAYDRLIEQPYLKNNDVKTRTRHGIFQGILVFIAVATLGILGYFRYESYRVSELKKGINQEIKALRQQNAPLIEGQLEVANPLMNQQVEAKLKAFNDLNISLVNSKWALMSFILSGILFAIAGAICLGIAFPSLQVYWKRWFRHSWNIMNAKIALKRNRKRFDKFSKSYFKNKAQLDFIEKKNEFFPKVSEVQLELNELENEQSEVLEKIKSAKEGVRISSFSEGFVTGDASSKTLTDDELEEFRKIQLDRLRAKQTDYPSKGGSLRPYQSLRKAIVDNMKGN